MNRFGGNSSLADKEEKQSSGPSQKQKDLKAYLEAKYSSKPAKKKKKAKATTASLRIVDNDITGFAPVEESQVKEIDPDAPVVVNLSEAVAAVGLHKKEKTRVGGWHTVDVGGEADQSEQQDMSPPRRTLYDEPEFETGGDDLSPPRRRSDQAEGPSAEADLSPPRRRRGGHEQHSPAGEDLSPPRRPSSHSHGRSHEKRRMVDGTRTGVVSADQMKEEMRKKRRQDKEKLFGMDDQATGRGAETVYRDKQGRRVTREELERQRAKEKKKIKWEKVEWDSGLVQQQDAKKHKADLEREGQKPFCRPRDDEDLDAMYRARRRWGDPMGHLDKKPKHANSKSIPELPPAINETNRHWFEKSGFVVPQEIPPHSWIRRGVAPVSNRYNIRPGRHWDGVDRSNGFEKEYAKYLNECAARDKEAAAWCMEDM